MFDNYFEIFLADTQEGREIHYNIRYQVYCEELGYEDSKKFPDQQEFDQWDPKDDQDQQSILFLVRLKHTKQWIGAMRLVHYNGHNLPLEENTSLNHAINSPAIEISRLCLVKDIRKPYLKNAYGIDENNTDENSPNTADEEGDSIKLFYSNPKVKSTIIWGLFHASSQYSIANNIKKWYLLSNRALARVIKRQGFRVEQVGSSCEHRGQRAPYCFDVDEIQSNPVWDNFNKTYQLYSSLQQQEKTGNAVKYG